MAESGARHLARALLTAVSVLGIIAVSAVAVVTWRTGWDLHDWRVQTERFVSGEAAAPSAAASSTATPVLAVPSAVAPTWAGTPIARNESGTLDPTLVEAALKGALSPQERRHLGPRVGIWVGELSTGRQVYADGPGIVTPASTTKLLTSAAALATIPGQTRFATETLVGPVPAKPGKPRTLWLKGGGDPELSAEALQTLAQQTVTALQTDTPTPKLRVRYDTSLFTGAAVDPEWEPSYIPDGVVSPIVPLWVDEGRDESGWGRVVDPARAAADVFATALRQAGARVVGEPVDEPTPPTATPVSRVESRPLSQIVQRILEVSDNEGTEVIARQVSLAAGGDGSSVNADETILQVLRDQLGLDVSGVQLYDGSGLSRRNRIPTPLLGAVVALAADPAHPELRPLLAGLPVAGFNGSLSERFVEQAQPGQGLVRAKTGTLTGVHGLAGTVTDAQGNVMVAVLVADRVKVPDTLAARADLDRMAAALAACSCGGS